MKREGERETERERVYFYERERARVEGGMRKRESISKRMSLASKTLELELTHTPKTMNVAESKNE